MSLHLIATGGTFDKRYDPITGQLVFATSHLQQIVIRARITADVTIQTLPLMDSLDMKDADRLRILEACEATPSESIVIVHGTDTMRETGEVLAQARLGKRIVLTGAMIPYQIADSDALFNLGFAMAAVQLTAPGVYLAMNGELFPWDGVIKNRAAGRFEHRT